MDLDSYLRSLEHAASEVPSILAEWAGLDLALWHEYTSQLVELICAAPEMTQRATDANRGSSYHLRVARALVEICAFETDIKHAMGVSVRHLVSGATDVKGAFACRVSAPPPEPVPIAA